MDPQTFSRASLDVSARRRPRRGGGCPGRNVAARAGRDYFRELGIRPFINAAGTYTAMTASLMPEEVVEAIEYASKHYVMLDELQDKVGARIATLVHSEAAMVTSGAASALTLGTAAVLTGTDQQKMVALPDLATMKSEVIVQKSHRFGYDHAVRNCGVRLVEVESREDLERAVNPKTAMMLFYNNNNKEGRMRDEEFVQLGKKHSIPTLQRCRRRRSAGREPVEVHEDGIRPGGVLGGKGIRGPQSAGLLLGRKDLIAAARFNAPPNGNTVGRGMKVNKEEMLGMLVALEMYLEKDHERERREFDKRAETIRSSDVRCPASRPKCSCPKSPTMSRTSASPGTPPPGGSRPARSSAPSGTASRRSPRVGERGSRRRRLDDAPRRGQDRRTAAEGSPGTEGRAPSRNEDPRPRGER